MKNLDLAKFEKASEEMFKTKETVVGTGGAMYNIFMKTGKQFVAYKLEKLTDGTVLVHDYEKGKECAILLSEDDISVIILRSENLEKWHEKRAIEAKEMAEKAGGGIAGLAGLAGMLGGR